MCEFVCLRGSALFVHLPGFNIHSLVQDDSAGAISTFVGTTRDHFAGKKVLKLEYEAYLPMALKELRYVLCACSILARAEAIVSLFPFQQHLRNGPLVLVRQEGHRPPSRWHRSCWYVLRSFFLILDAPLPLH